MRLARDPFRATTMPRLKSLLFYLPRPVYAARALASKIGERTRGDEPWIARGAVAFCEAHLRPDQEGLEWGSGRSTRWYAQRLGKLTSVEHDPAWYEVVRGQVAGTPEGARIDLRHVPLDHSVSAPSFARYDVMPAYVRVAEGFPEGSLDFVVVDGHYRQACVLAALPRLRPGGLLLVDNSDWIPLAEWGVPADWPVAHRSRNFMTETTVWRKP